MMNQHKLHSESDLPINQPSFNVPSIVDCILKMITPYQEELPPTSAELNTLRNIESVGNINRGIKDVQEQEDDFEETSYSLNEGDYIPHNDDSFTIETKWIMKNLPPEFQIGMLEDVINKFVTDKPVLGYYANRVIYISKELSSNGTGYHEAFHGVFAELMNAERRAFFIEKALERIGEISVDQIDQFKKDRNITGKTNEQIRNKIAEEYLADGFKKYMVENHDPAQGWFKMFVKALQRILKFFTGKSNSLDRMYCKVSLGQYSMLKNNKTSTTEGAFDLGRGRPTLKIVTVGDEKRLKPFANMVSNRTQQEITNRLTRMVSGIVAGTFAEKFEFSRELLIREFDTEQLLADVIDQNKAAALAKYQEQYYENQFILGKSVPYIYSPEAVAAGENTRMTTAKEAEATIAIIKKDVEAKIKSLGIEGGWFESMEEKTLKEDPDNEANEIAKKSSDFANIHMNPRDGMSAQFKALFSLVPLTSKDEATGVTHTRVIDGSGIFDAIMQIAADNEPNRIFHAFLEFVELMESEESDEAPVMRRMFDFFKDELKLDDDMKPGANTHFHQQFVSALFVTEYASHQLLLTSSSKGSVVNIKDASIQADIGQVMDKWAETYERDFQRLPVEGRQKRLGDLSETLNPYFDPGIGRPMKNIKMDSESLNKAAKRIKAAFDKIGLELPKYLIARSLAGIYVIEEKHDLYELNKNSNAFKYICAQPQLFQERAFLQKDFFRQFVAGKVKADINLFEPTFNFGSQSGNDTAINMINGILRKAAKMVVKFDVTRAVPVFKNTDGKTIFRYAHITPLGSLLMVLRNEGIKGIIKRYPGLATWFEDNFLSNESDENKLFLKNFEIGLFGGFRQTLNNVKRKGVTFESIDPATFYLSNIIFFLDRDTISNSKTQITIFRCSSTQNEDTSTNYIISGLYQRLTNKDGKVGQLVIDKLMQSIKQEYNRIQKEWGEKDIFKNRYIDFNGRKNENGQLITNDPALKAYNFIVLNHFFKDQIDLKIALINAAKFGIPFEVLKSIEMDGFDGTIKQNLEWSLLQYMDKSLNAYKKELVKYKIIKKETDGTYSSQLIPTTIKYGYEKTSIRNEGFTIDSLLNDQWLNIFLNRIIVNQIFDGDTGMFVEESIEYNNRNKYSASNGLSLMSGLFRTAVFDEIIIHINPQFIELGGYENGEDIPHDFSAAFLDKHNVTSEKVHDGFEAQTIFEGQSVQTMNHRIVMMEKIGRTPPDVIFRLKKARYQKMSDYEIIANQQQNVTNKTINSVTGGIIHYIKTSEHLLLRTDVSILQIKAGQKIEDAENALKELHDRIDVMESQLIENSWLPKNAEQLETDITALYKQVHEYWIPIRGREKLHHLLSSMELSGIDQAYAPNASKKATLIPVTLNVDKVTDLKPAKTYIENRFKFINQYTSDDHDSITAPTQALKLITAYLTDHEDKDLVKMAEKYSVYLGKRAEAANEKVNRILQGENGDVDISNLYTAMHKSLVFQNADSNTLKMLEQSELKDKDGNGTGQFRPIHNLNFPFIKKLFTYYYFSFYSANVFSEKVAGRHNILVSSYGYEVLHEVSTGKIIIQEEQRKNPAMYADEAKYATRPLGISVTEDENKVKTYMVETMLAKPMFENASHRALWEKECAIFFATRIPTEDKRSMIVCKVVDYLDESYLSTIIVPHFIHMLAGSNLNANSLYSHVQAIYKDFNNNYHKYGDFSTYINHYEGSESTETFTEYIHYFINDPVFKDLLDAEKVKVEKDMILPDELNGLMEEINFIWKGETKEFLEDQIRELKTNKAELEYAVKESKENAFEINTEIEEQNAWIKTKEQSDQYVDETEQRKILEDISTININSEQHDINLEIIPEHIQQLKDAIKRTKNLVTIIAAINLLKLKNMPHTNAGLELYKKDTDERKGINPVIPVIQNSILDTKIAILSHKEVFHQMYIRDNSNLKTVEAVAASIGSDIKAMLNAHSLFSIQGDVIANKLYRSNEKSIAISGAFIKFLSFAVKKGLTLKDPMFYTIPNDIDDDGVHDSFKDKDIKNIKEIGGLLRIFKEGTYNPIAAVLNLNEITAIVTHSMIGLGMPLQTALLINKIPIIEEITERVIAANGAVSTSDGIYDPRTFKSVAKKYIDDFRKNLIASNQLNVLYIVDVENKNNILYTPSGTPILQKIVMSEKQPSVAFQQNPTLDNLGFILTKDGLPVSEEIATYYLLEKWLAINHLNHDVQKVSTVLNLVKKLDPSFEKNDTILENYEYLLSGESEFKNIDEMLRNSEEYTPLVSALRQMNAYAEKIVLERNDIMYALDKTIRKGFNGFSMASHGNREKLTDQLLKFIITNKFKDNATEAMNELKKDPVKNAKNIASYEDILKYYTADYWMNNDFKDDVYYLMENFKGNAFVDFIKVENRSGFEMIESMSRMKLDKNITESIINGFQALVKSSDPKGKWIANKLFVYSLVKDGMGFSNNSFIKYLDPSMKQFLRISASLNELRALLKNANIEITAINNAAVDPTEKINLTKERINNVFTTYFKADNTALTDFIHNMISTIGTYEGNSAFRILSKTFNEKLLTGEVVSEKELKDIYILIEQMFPLTNKVIQEYKQTTKKWVKEEWIKMDLFIPSHLKPGIGKIEINLHLPTDSVKLATRMLGLAHINPVYNATGLQGYEFPLFIVNKWDQVLHLSTIDDSAINQYIEGNIIKYISRDSNINFRMIGLKATYVLTENTGTKYIMNSAFTQEEGVKLNKHIVTLEENKAAEKIEKQEALAKKNGVKVFTTPVATKSEPIVSGSIHFEDSVLEKLLSGKKSLMTMPLKNNLQWGRNKMNDGRFVDVSSLGVATVKTINGETKVHFGSQAIPLDMLAQCEGYKDWAEFSETEDDGKGQKVRKDGSINLLESFVSGIEGANLYTLKVVSFGT